MDIEFVTDGEDYRDEQLLASLRNIHNNRKTAPSAEPSLAARLDKLHAELARANDLVEQEAKQEEARGLSFIARLFGRR